MRVNICPTINVLMMFLYGQGYGIIKNVVYQDNKSAIRMDKKDHLYDYQPNPRI